MGYDFDIDVEFTDYAAEPEVTYQRRNPEMRMAWQFVAETGISVFLTGKAGTGKTTFLRHLRELMPKRMVVLAPTGVAAINAGGQTIHSFFQIPFGPFVPGGHVADSKRMFQMSDKKKALIRSVDLVVIDEVSMVRADLLDAVDDVLRKYRDSTRPFGGVQMLLIGDLMQLSPVTKDQEWSMLSQYYSSPYFFASRALQQLKYVTIELRHIYRQQDEDFISLLAKVRTGDITPEVIETLNSRFIPNFQPKEDGWIRLTTHNYAAQNYNEERMRRLPGDEMRFVASVKGDFPEVSYPCDYELRLKLNAQVMFVKNDPSGGHLYYNGKIGTVVAFMDDEEEGQSIIVSCQEDGEEPEQIRVVPVVWENRKYAIDPNTKEIKEQVDGTFTQYPLRLAWAITVHKSQGLTFDHAVLDINASFAHGQVYVALSRCRTLQGLVLSAPISGASVITDRSVEAYIDRELEAESKNCAQLPAYKSEYLLFLLDELYSFRQIDESLRWLERVVDEYLSRQYPDLLRVLKGAQEPVAAALIRVGLSFRREYAPQIAERGTAALEALQPRVQSSAKYFVDKLESLFLPLLKQCAINIENKQTAQIYGNALDSMRDAVRAKMQIFQALVEKPFSVSEYLDLKAKAMLGETLAPPARNRRERAPRPPRADREPKPKKPDTREETFKLFEQGLSVSEIAKKRGLVESTIYGHLATLVMAGRIVLNQVVPPERQLQILEAVDTFDGPYSLSDVREKLSEDFSFGEIRTVINCLRRPQQSSAEE
ncbi:MAG: helix-turn-helix domain-containing protein [Bacteroidales bacterium]|nr:helix-turn-helix domain-containing protein [Bacteroidales bacterium]